MINNQGCKEKHSPNKLLWVTLFIQFVLHLEFTTNSKKHTFTQCFTDEK